MGLIDLSYNSFLSNKVPEIGLYNELNILTITTLGVGEEMCPSDDVLERNVRPHSVVFTFIY